MNQTIETVESMPRTESVPPRSGDSIDRRSIDTSTLSLRAQLIELETEHLRLQRLVAELLIKNQKLREFLCEQGGTSKAAASFCRDGEATHYRHSASH